MRRFFQKRIPRTVDPDDLVQEVFLRLARRADLADIENVEGYLFRTAANVLTDRYRRDASAPPNQESFDDALHGQAVLTPERVLIGKESVELLTQALHELPEKTRHIYVLYHFECERQADIAKMLAMPVSTVEKHMARANRHLLKRLRQAK